jgi:hypothetical protein
MSPALPPMRFFISFILLKFYLKMFERIYKGGIFERGTGG